MFRDSSEISVAEGGADRRHRVRRVLPPAREHPDNRRGRTRGEAAGGFHDARGRRCTDVYIPDLASPGVRAQLERGDVSHETSEPEQFNGEA